MNFDFSSEQEELRRQARRLLGGGPQAARARLASGAEFDAALWQQAVELGWTAAAVDEEHGGLGLGALELCVLAEEVGRTLAPIPFAASVLQATELLRLAARGGSAVAAAWLPRLAAGEVIGTVALAEAGGRGSWLDTPTTRVLDGGLGGVKTPVADAGAAQIAIVSARDEAGTGLWLVVLDQPGVKRVALDAIDLVHPHAALHLDGAAGERIDAGDAPALLRRLLDVAAVTTAFEQLGAAEALLETTVEYVKTRKAFGREVGGYQAVKHRLADLYVKIQLARSHAYYGAWALSNDAPELPRAAAGARLAALDALAFAAEESVELHGGIGFTWECDLQLYYRRARSLAVGLGGRPFWSRALVDALVAEAGTTGA